jgi:hypothetical protein
MADLYSQDGVSQFLDPPEADEAADVEILS